MARTAAGRGGADNDGEWWQLRSSTPILRDALRRIGINTAPLVFGVLEDVELDTAQGDKPMAEVIGWLPQADERQPFLHELLQLREASRCDLKRESE